MMGEQNEAGYSPEDTKAAAEVLKKEVLFGAGNGGPVAPTWTLQMIAFDDEIVEFDGFNLNYNDSKGAVILFDLPMLVTGRTYFT